MGLTVTRIPGANYGEYWPNGLGYNSTVLPDGYPDDLLLFTRVSKDGRIAGKGHSNAALWYWDGAHWITLLTATTPNNPLAFHPVTGELYIALGDGVHVHDRSGLETRVIPGYVGSQGIRQVNADGSMQTGDATYGDGTVNEYTDCGDVRIGQGHDAGGIVAVLDGAPRHVIPGAQQMLRCNRVGDSFAIYGTDFTQGYLVLCTRAELAALPPMAPPIPIGPTTPARAADGRKYNTAPFTHCDPALSARGGPGQQENVQVDRADGIILYGKFGQAGSYETYAIDANWFYSLEDASGPTETQSWTDPRWFPVEQAIGEAHAFVTGPHEAIWKDRHTCVEIRRAQFNRKMWLHALWDGFYWGPELGTRATIMRVYDPTAGFHSPHRIIEVRYEAYGAGWCRWEAHRSDVVYANGPAQFTELSLVQRVDFYRLGGKNVQPVLTGCTPPVCPHYPPLVPASGDYMIDPKTVILYQSKKFSSRAGCTNYILPNGRVFSCQADGSPGDRDPGTDGPWEQGQESGNLATFQSGGHFYVFGVAPVDKVA